MVSRERVNTTLPENNSLLSQQDLNADADTIALKLWLAVSNDAYAYGGLVAVDRAYGVNGLNQSISAGSASFTYEANLQFYHRCTNTYVYHAENRLISASNGTTLTYDPLGRLWRVAKAAADSRFLTDGDELVAEYDGSGELLRRYVHGGSVDEPMVQYEGSGLTIGDFSKPNTYPR